MQALCLFEEDGGMTEWRHSTPLGGAGTCLNPNTCALWRSLDGQRVPAHHMIRSSGGHRAQERSPGGLARRQEPRPG